MDNIKQILEDRQISVYFGAVVIALSVAFCVPGTTVLEGVVNPSLAFMLFVTFLQVPLIEIKQAFLQGRFLAVLLAVNFVILPIFVYGLVQLLPVNPLIRVGVMLVLLTPCIDYVVTFSHAGRADARLLLAATPSLLILQMVLLPFYLRLFLGNSAAGFIQLGPFIHAFIWLILVPVIFAGAMQLWAGRSSMGKNVSTLLGLLPVPATALVLFIVIAAVVPQLRGAFHLVGSVIPIYVAFAIVAPLIGWCAARSFRLSTRASRAVAFSSATRNSLVILPLALAVPDSVPVLPAIIVTQTLVELVSQLLYVRLSPKLGADVHHT